MTWQYSCDVTKKAEQHSVIIDKEKTPQKGSLRAVFLVAATSVTTALLFVFSQGFFPGNADSRSQGWGDAAKTVRMEKKLAELDRKLAEFHQRLAVVEEMDKDVGEINRVIERFSDHYNIAEKARNETLAQLNRRLDDLQKKAATGPKKTRYQKKDATPSRTAPPFIKTDKGENPAKPGKKPPIKTKGNDTHVSSVASAATRNTDNRSKDSAASGSTDTSSRDSTAAGNTDNLSPPAEATGSTDKNSGTTIAAVTPGKETASTRVIKKISKKTPAKKRMPRYHKVRSGETLFRIGKRYNLTVTRLKKINNLTSGAIYIGQRLKVGTTVIR